MDKSIIIKLLGKQEAVILDDSIYNLRDIAYELRNVIILKLPIDQEVKKNIQELQGIDIIIKPMFEVLNGDSTIKGYTNSKLYLSKYLRDISTYISGIISALEINDVKELTFNTNMLMDCILRY